MSRSGVRRRSDSGHRAAPVCRGALGSDSRSPGRSVGSRHAHGCREPCGTRPARCSQRCSRRFPAAIAAPLRSRLFAPRLQGLSNLLVAARASRLRVGETTLNHRGECQLLEDLVERAVVRLLIDDAAEPILRRRGCSFHGIDCSAAPRRRTGRPPLRSRQPSLDENWQTI